MSGAFKVLIGVSCLLLVLMALVGFAAPLVTVVQLLFGWIYYLGRVIPSIRVEPSGVVLGAICLIGVAVLGHWMASWLWRETRSDGNTPRWKFRWTGMSLGVVLLMFICGIAATGVAHQAGWLVRSEEAVFTYSRRPAMVRIMCGSNMRQIGQAIREYAEEHEGRLPDSLAQLPGESRFDLPSACPGSARLDYTYYGRGLTWPVGEDIPLLAEPLANHEGQGMNILFGDGSARFVPADEAEAILARRPR